MAFYFVCPGEASVTSSTVSCSMAITTIEREEGQKFTHQDYQSIIDSFLGAIALWAVFWLIKKAIEL